MEAVRCRQPHPANCDQISSKTAPQWGRLHLCDDVNEFLCDCVPLVLRVFLLLRIPQMESSVLDPGEIVVDQAVDKTSRRYSRREYLGPPVLKYRISMRHCLCASPSNHCSTVAAFCLAGSGQPANAGRGPAHRRMPG